MSDEDAPPLPVAPTSKREFREYLDICSEWAATDAGEPFDDWGRQLAQQMDARASGVVR